MRINKDNISDSDKELAVSILNKLRAGNRVIGNPAEGLKKTLRELDSKLKESQKTGPLSFKVSNKDLIGQIRLLKAGINGEETLADYIEKLIKHNPKLDGLIVFASLSSEQEDDNLDYIPDTDFVAVYGNNILILDAKNIVTSPDIPIYIDENVLKNPSKELIELHPSTYVWENIFKKTKTNIDSIDGCCVIINKNGALILKNKEWYSSPCRPIFIGDLNEFLENWIKNKDNTVSLKLLTEIAKTQSKSFFKKIKKILDKKQNIY